MRTGTTMMFALAVLAALATLPSPAHAQEACPTRLGWFFRYVGTGERDAIERDGAVPATNQLGHLKDLYVTDCFFVSRVRAQAVLSLKYTPAYRVQFQLPLARCDEPVKPDYDQPGGGHQCILHERIAVENPAAQIAPLR